MGLFITVCAQELIKHKFRISQIYKGNYLLGTVTAFTFCSLFYMWFPFFEVKMASILGFRYDVVFLLALVVGLYIARGKQDLNFYFRTLSISTFGILAVFLPWYLFGDISTLAAGFGYSAEVSTYTANSCISFAQGVEGQYRFQGTFGWPIRFSVFLTVVYCLFAGYILSRPHLTHIQKYGLVAGFGLLVIPSIFFSYSKTSILGLVFAGGIFVYLARKYIYKKTISRNFMRNLAMVIALPIIAIALFKSHLFLHLGAILNRLENLGKSIEMFFYNPIGYGLGIAWPASQIGNSIESAGSWQIATSTTRSVHKFLPENWYVQILLEQGIVGFFLFISILAIIGVQLWKKVKKQKDFMSIGLFSAFCALCFMANFTHAFEESATVYPLFLFIGIYLADSVQHVRKRKKK